VEGGRVDGNPVIVLCLNLKGKKQLVHLELFNGECLYHDTQCGFASGYYISLFWPWTIYIKVTSQKGCYRFGSGTISHVHIE